MAPKAVGAEQRRLRFVYELSRTPLWGLPTAVATILVKAARFISVGAS